MGDGTLTPEQFDDTVTEDMLEILTEAGIAQ